MMAGLVISALMIVSVAIALQAAYTLFIMLYAWDRPHSEVRSRAPDRFLPPRTSFSVILPARHEEEVIQTTIEQVVRSNYPPSLLQVLVVCSEDDTGTIGTAKAKIEALRREGVSNVEVVVFDDGPVNKPHGLNIALSRSRNQVVTLFDAEDDVHPDIFDVVNTVMLEEGVKVLQAGIQLMNYRSNWYSTLNVLEYFFWFKSSLPYYARYASVRLGGNTVFFSRELLHDIGGWDERNLTEDAEIGIRISALGEEVRVVYDDRYVTREETPPTLGQFIRQRTRWHQGFMQTFGKGDWKQMPTWTQRWLAVYTLMFPNLQPLLTLYAAASVVVILTVRLPVLAALVCYLPFLLLAMQFVTSVLGLHEFADAHGLRPSRLMPLWIAVTWLPYQAVLAYATLRALRRQLTGVGNWEKTRHVGAHRRLLDAGLERATGCSPHPGSGRESCVRPATALASMALPAGGATARGGPSDPSVEPKPASPPGDAPRPGEGGWRQRGRAPELSVAQARRPEALRPHPSSPRGRLDGALLALSMASGAISHGYYLFSYPLYSTDEGIYMQQAWSVIREARLSPHTYVYDHAPGGWLLIAGWVNFLPAQFETFGSVIDTGRALMLIVHVVNVFLLFEIARRLSGSSLAGVVAAFFFNFSPLAVIHQRAVVLDNLMVFWLLLSILLVVRCEARIMGVAAAGLAFGLATVTKESAIFFGPVLVLLLFGELAGSPGHRFAKSFWAFASSTPLGSYVLYAALKDELFPTGLNFNLDRPPADHVSLLYTLWWQLHRSQGSILDRNSLVWQHSLGTWLTQDGFILVAGGLATVISLLICFRDRRQNLPFLIAAALCLSYALYLFRTGVMLEFYVVPLLPFLALVIGMVCARGLLRAPGPMKAIATTVMFALLLLPTGGYLVVRPNGGGAQLNNLYRLQLTDLQEQEVAWVRQHISPTATLIIDDDIWPDLHDRKPYYRFAESHWTAAADPAVRDGLFAADWRGIDYIVMSDEMRTAMEQNNAEGREGWILEAVDHHSRRVWSARQGGVLLEIYQIQKNSAAPGRRPLAGPR
jgi:glycosyltransferase XagB